MTSTRSEALRTVERDGDGLAILAVLHANREIAELWCHPDPGYASVAVNASFDLYRFQLTDRGVQDAASYLSKPVAL